MATRRRFLRVFGVLWETGEFEPGVGWETERLARRPRHDPDHQLHLADEAGNVLAEGAVELRVPTCRARGADGPSATKVVGCLPLHPGGRAVLLRRGERVLHRAVLAAERPQITRFDVEAGGDGLVRVGWAAEHERPLRFNLVFVDALRRAISVARGLSENELVLDSADLPGGAGCTLALLATDGLRSATVRSRPFRVPDKPPRVVILTPAEGQTLAPDQPVSLLGHAHDLAGRPLPDEQLTWSVDGNVVGKGQRLTASAPLEPGGHRVELSFARDGQLAGRAEVRVEVARRSREQEDWLRIAREVTTVRSPAAS